MSYVQIKTSAEVWAVIKARHAMSTQEQRERFEEWASEQQGYFSRQTAWAAWQAAEAAAIERCAKAAETVPLESFASDSYIRQTAKNRTQIVAAIRALLPKEES